MLKVKGEHAQKVSFVNDSFGLVKIQIKMILEPDGGAGTSLALGQLCDDSRRPRNARRNWTSSTG